MTKLAPVLVLLACDGGVTLENQAAGSTSGAGAGGMAPDGGSTGGAGTGGAAPVICGGKAGAGCAADAWCAFDPAGSCGVGDQTGECQPRPEGCPADCPGVCGCDGKFHCSACSAHAVGVDVSSSMACFGSYSAVSLFTGVPRFVLFKTDITRNVCFRLMFEGGTGPGIGITNSMGWSVAMAEITNDVDDCKLVNGYPPPPAGSSAQAIAGSGKFVLEGNQPCKVTIDATLSFDAQAPWIPPTESIDAESLEVEGGCT